jgi:hypothetical protein
MRARFLSSNRFSARTSARLLALAVGVFLLVLSSLAHADPVRILVSVGHRQGLEAEQPLHHATKDAARVREAFVTLGGVSADNAILLREPTKEELWAGLDKAKQLAEAHNPNDVTFIFYYSGHGDREKLHLGGTTIPLDELSAHVGRVPAALRIVVTDACRTASVRVKGASAEEPFAISLSQPAATGVVWLNASADGEAAQESDELGGAIFTHYWLSGLFGAADKDGDAKVTLSESYDFAYNETLYRSAQSTGVVQRPAATFAVKENAPVVLTQTARGSTSLRFPASSDAYYVVYAAASRSVAAEVWGTPDRTSLLALPAGNYTVQRRVHGAVSATQIALASGDQKTLASDDFQPVKAMTLAAKGEDADMIAPPVAPTPKNELGVAWGPSVSRVSDFSQHVALSYAHSWDRLALSFALDGGLGQQKTTAEDVRLQWVGAAARVEYRMPLGPVKLRFGIGPEAEVIGQTLKRTDGTEVARAGYSTQQSYTAFAWGGGAIAGLRIPLGQWFWADVSGRGSMLAANLGTSVGGLWTAGGDVGVGFNF